MPRVSRGRRRRRREGRGGGEGGVGGDVGERGSWDAGSRGWAEGGKAFSGSMVLGTVGSGLDRGERDRGRRDGEKRSEARLICRSLRGWRKRGCGLDVVRGGKVEQRRYGAMEIQRNEASGVLSIGSLRKQSRRFKVPSISISLACGNMRSQHLLGRGSKHLGGEV